MTVEQISERHNYTIGTLYHKLSGFIKSGFITTGTIKGYATTDNSLKLGKYYKLTGKGITYLRESGYELEKNAEDLRISDFRVQNILHYNDMVTHFSSHVWSVLDSRQVKLRRSLNRGDVVDGMLISPEKREYIFYLLLNKVSNYRMIKLILELNRNEYSDVILFFNSKGGFKSVLNEMLLNAEVYKYNSFRLMPLVYGMRYLAYYNDSQVLFNYLEDEFNIYAVEKNKNERYQVDFKTIVEYKGTEYYLVSMLDHNLTNLHFIKNYTKERYEQDGRKILLLRTDLIDYKDYLAGIHHVEYMEVNTNEFMNYPTR